MCRTLSKWSIRTISIGLLPELAVGPPTGLSTGFGIAPAETRDSRPRFPWSDSQINHDYADYLADNYYPYDNSPYFTGTNHPTYATDATPYSRPVGSFAPNESGLCDAAGNMAEWC